MIKCRMRQAKHLVYTREVRNKNKIVVEELQGKRLL
jgi:hypothetical protein